MPSISADRHLTQADNARYFAMMYTAADGAISCWNDKAAWSSLRPITAIRIADRRNPATVADPNWGVG